MEKSTTYLALCALMAFCVGCMQPKQSEYVTQHYTADWNSLVNYQAPEWYEDAKIGFWPIWGVYSLPAFKGDHAAEWYGRWMYCQEGQSSRDNQGLATHMYHKETYGDPSTFGYKDFIPQFTAKAFDADEWVSICKEGGARFITALAIFHDNFALWDSQLTPWNSVAMGPRRDIVAELKQAATKQGLKFGVSNHAGWNYCFYQWNHINRYDAADPANADLYGRPIVKAGADTIRMYVGESRNSFEKRSREAVEPSISDLNGWLDKSKELVDLYQPDLFYFDWGINIGNFEPYRRDFAAHYYNKSIHQQVGTPGSPNVVLNYKGWGTYKYGSAVRDIERGGMEGIQDMVWQTDDCIYGGHNWGYAKGEPIKETNIIVDELMDIISKRGVLMLAIAPDGDGRIPERQRNFMKELGAWLNICGEAVYATRPYKTYGEKSPAWGAPDAHGYKTYIGTPKDIRYTRSKDHLTLYATYLDWPGSEVTIASLADLDVIESIQLVGVDKDLQWETQENGLHIALGEKPHYDFAFPIRIKLKETIK